MNLNRRKQREQRFKSLSLKLPPADSTLAGEAIHVWLPLILCFLCFLLFIHLPFKDESRSHGNTQQEK
jgi:hypothetical protein